MVSFLVPSLAKCPIPSQVARLGGGGPMEVGVVHPSPNPRLGSRGPERKKARGTVSVGRRAP